MITREQVADLQPGDVVELHRQGWAKDVVVRGTVQGDTCVNEFWIGDYSLRSETDQVPEWFDFPGTTLTVVSRAPRPLYVNHDRFCPAFGDVVRNAADAGDRRTWQYRDPADTKPWVGESESNVAPFRWWNRRDLPTRLRLLVDGETGEVVP